MENIKKDEVFNFSNERMYIFAKFLISHEDPPPRLPNHVDLFPPSPRSTHSLNLDIPDDLSLEPKAHANSGSFQQDEFPSVGSITNVIPSYYQVCLLPSSQQSQADPPSNQIMESESTKMSRGRKRRRSFVNQMQLEQQRLEKNKLSARESRKKKKLYIQKVEDQVHNMQIIIR